MTSTTGAGARPSSRAATSPDHVDPLVEAATVLTLPFTLARHLLPDDPVPVALGVGALAVAGLVEWPVAAAVGLGYLALRRWRRS